VPNSPRGNFPAESAPSHLRCIVHFPPTISLRALHTADMLSENFSHRGGGERAADNSSVSRDARAHYPSYIIIFINIKLHTYGNLSVSLPDGGPHPYAGNESNALITGFYASEISVVASQRAAKAPYNLSEESARVEDSAWLEGKRVLCTARSTGGLDVVNELLRDRRAPCSPQVDRGLPREPSRSNEVPTRSFGSRAADSPANP